MISGMSFLVVQRKWRTAHLFDCLLHSSSNSHFWMDLNDWIVIGSWKNKPDLEPVAEIVQRGEIEKNS